MYIEWATILSSFFFQILLSPWKDELSFYTATIEFKVDMIWIYKTIESTKRFGIFFIRLVIINEDYAGRWCWLVPYRCSSSKSLTEPSTSYRSQCLSALITTTHLMTGLSSRRWSSVTWTHTCELFNLGFSWSFFTSSLTFAAQMQTNKETNKLWHIAYSKLKNWRRLTMF